MHWNVNRVKKKSSFWARNDFQHVCFFTLFTRKEAIIYIFYFLDRIDVVFQVLDGSGTFSSFVLTVNCDVWESMRKKQVTKMIFFGVRITEKSLIKKPSWNNLTYNYCFLFVCCEKRFGWKSNSVRVFFRLSRISEFTRQGTKFFLRFIIAVITSVQDIVQKLFNLSKI